MCCNLHDQSSKDRVQRCLMNVYQVQTHKKKNFWRFLIHLLIFQLPYFFIIDLGCITNVTRFSADREATNLTEQAGLKTS